MKNSVRTYSTFPFQVVGWSESLNSAKALMASIPARHLPVVDDNGAIVGMLSDRDLNHVIVRNSESVVKDYMTQPVEHIDENSSISAAAKKMLDGKFSALIVTNKSRAVGILTTDDLLKTMVINDRESSFSILQNGLASALYNSPISSIAQTLSNSGI